MKRLLLLVLLFCTFALQTVRAEDVDPAKRLCEITKEGVVDFGEARKFALEVATANLEADEINIKLETRERTGAGEVSLFVSKGNAYVGFWANPDYVEYQESSGRVFLAWYPELGWGSYDLKNSKPGNVQVTPITCS